MDQSAATARTASPSRRPAVEVPVSAPRPTSEVTEETLRAHLAPASAVDAFMAAYLHDLPIAPNLKAAIEYALLGPGKRVRPVLAWHSARAVGGMGEASLPGGCAVEFIHAFSLVHDDLPAMDDDDLRRGRPTLHKHAGEAMAILAGDEMLNLGFRLICERVKPGALAARLCHELAVGTSGMISGQVYDTLGGYAATLSGHDRLRLIHKNKTGALIRAACRMGAMGALGDLPEADPRLAAITAYAEAMGLMFQVVDDILDVTQTAEHLGKKSGKDADAGKATYPGVLGLEASHAEVRRLLAAATDALQPLGTPAGPLLDLAQYMAVRTR